MRDGVFADDKPAKVRSKHLTDLSMKRHSSI